MGLLIAVIIKLSKFFLMTSAIILLGIAIARRKNVIDKLIFFAVVVVSTLIATRLYGNNFQQYLLLIQPFSLALIIFDVANAFKPNL